MYRKPADVTIRRVWAAISREPQATCRELSEYLNLSSGCVAAALRELRYAGYIRFRKYHTGRTILVPFVVQDLEATNGHR